MSVLQAYGSSQGRSCNTLDTIGSDAIDILIVDDEFMVRRVLQMILNGSGLRVATAANGVEAVRLFEEHHGNVRLVLLDVQMPEMDGPHALQAMRVLNPGLRALFMSGAAGAYTFADLSEAGAIGLIDKPFRDLSALAERLRRLIGAPIAQAR
jgi:CheY-like chemotaxis protein